MLAFNAGGMRFLTDGIVFVNCESLGALLYKKKNVSQLDQCAKGDNLNCCPVQTLGTNYRILQIDVRNEADTVWCTWADSYCLHTWKP